MPNSAKPQMITWARKRAKMRPEDLPCFKNLPSWEAGTTTPTFRELYEFAEAVYVPVGYLLADEPPEEPLPIKDFRSYKSGTESSLELRDTIYACILQKDWYRLELQEAGKKKAPFVASATLQDDPEAIAKEFASMLDFGPASTRRKKGNLADAFSLLRKKADQIGIVVNVSNVVLNTCRKLNAQEFRGFALSDEYAPLVFVNSADSKSGQLFTLAHELGHLLLGVSAFDDGSRRAENKRAEELWCNRFAAELLVPEADLRSKKKNSVLDLKELETLAIYFNVSRPIILLCLLRINMITKKEFEWFWDKGKEAEAAAQKKSRSSGYYDSVIGRVGSTFSEALCQSTANSHTLTRDAMRLLGVKKLASYLELEKRILRR